MNKSSLIEKSQHAPETGGERGPEIRSVRKKLSGIAGLDEITSGGLPDGRLTAVIGGPGAGKSLFALQYLLNRANSIGEPGIFVTFEESIDRVLSNISGLDWNLDPIHRHKVGVVDARIPGDTVQAGAFDFAGLLAGLTARKAETGAVNVVFDGIDLLMSHLNDEYLERQELVRLDEWIRAEGSFGMLTVKSYGRSDRDQRRVDLIEYVTDCVVFLDAKLYDSAIARTLRVLKYRGSGFVANAVPMIIGSSGIEVVPSQISRESYPVFSERLTSGILRLDAILDGGYIRGSSVLVTGTPGTAKTSLSSSFVAAACAAGRKALFVSFDESDAQIIANMKSIGLDLRQHVVSGRLVMASLRSKGHSPEECFLRIYDLISRHEPDVLVVDPMSTFSETRYPFAAALGDCVMDLAKSRGITFLSTSLLTQSDGSVETSASHVSTIADTWIHLSYLVRNGERNRVLTIIKSRGTGHSNQVRELVLGSEGLDLVDVFAGEGGVLVGSARAEKMEGEARDEILLGIEHRQRQFELDANIGAIKMQIQTLNQELESKLNEHELQEAAETVRIESRKAAAAHRLLLRRKADDTQIRGRLGPEARGAEL